MSTPFDATTAKRLLFVRFLFRQGVEQSYKPYPLNAAGMLCFQDAVELFLVIAGQHLGANITDKMPFEQSFGEVETKLKERDGNRLPKRGAIFQVNKHRVNLKHYGLPPSSQALEESRRDVDTFLSTATSLVFGMDLDEIDLADLVTQQATAALLRRADASAKAEVYKDAAVNLRAAFEELLSDYAARKKTWYNTGPYSFGPRPRTTHQVQVFKRPMPKYQSTPDDLFASVNQLGKDVQALSQATAAMQEAMRVLAMGLDYRAYARFSMLTPETMSINGVLQPRTALRAPFGRDEYAFCREFVIEAALQLAELDFDLDLPALERQARAEQEAGDAPGEQPN